MRHLAGRGAWERWRTSIAAGYLAWFLVPLLLASIYRPLGFWDYLTGNDLFHFGEPARWGTLASNYWLNLVSATYVMRPTAVLLYDLQTLLFGGEFWIWYVVKWGAQLGAVGLAAWVAGRLGCGWWARAAMAAMLLTHPARFALMLHAPDGWVALGMLGQMALLVECGGEVGGLSRGRLALLHGLALFTMGAKETGYVFEVALAGSVLAWRRENWRRMVPLLALIGFWTVRLAGLRSRADGFEMREWWFRLSEQTKLLTPGSVGGVLAAALCGLAGLGLWQTWRRRREFGGRLLCLCWVGGAMMLAFTTIPPYYGLRYEIPTLYLLSVPVAVALESLGRRQAVVCGLLVAVYPLLTAGQVYSQEVAYHEEFFAESLALHRMEEAAGAGMPLVMTGLPGDFDGEYLNTVRHYFAGTGVHWYGLQTARQVRMVNAEGWPEEPFLLFSRWNPYQLLGPGMIARTRVERIQAVMAAHHGTLWRLAEMYRRLDRAMGYRERYPIDYGAALPASGPYCYLYVVSGKANKEFAEWSYEEIRFPRTPGAF